MTQETQKTKFWQNPLTGAIETVPVDFEPVVAVTLPSTDIEAIKKEAYDRGFKEGYKSATSSTL